MSENQNKEESISLLIWLVVGAIILWGIMWWSVFNNLPDWPSRGQFGDLFGSINALFSGLAFAGIIYTIYLQRKELKLQRDEMKASRAELNAQVKAQEYANSINIGQIKTASMQAQIEIFKIKIEGQGPEVRRSMIEKMESIANEINEFAEELEQMEY